MEMKKLFEPIKIGKMEIKNRIAFAPTHMGTAAGDGSVSDQTLCHYVARAKGGVGLIIVEAALITEKYAATLEHYLACYHDRHLSGLRDLAAAIHAYGAKAMLQLVPGQGAQALFSRGEKDLVAPSAIPSRIPKGSAPPGLKGSEGVVGGTPRPLTTEEVEGLEKDFVRAALLAKKAGFDGVEAHGAHGYLLAEFLSPLNNQREDAYGGSFEKRLTFSLNLIRKTRAKTGAEFVLGYRISGDEHTPGGLTLEDTQQIVPKLVQAGLDYILLSSGRYEAFAWTFPPEEGVMLPESKGVKEAAKVPVICPNIHKPSTGEQGLNGGMADMIALSRALIADPDWANKTQEGKVEEITECIKCNQCVRQVSQRLAVRCAVNPRVGFERFIPEYFPPF
jgi:2,4-dienoyl-CoA reductase-like NADH-dependent reductase (Old Yellow Enzyme family)